MKGRAFRSFIILANILSCINSFWSASAADSGNETDRLALLAFKNQITRDPLGALTLWNDSIHFCEWQGVGCSRRHHRVTVLNLEGQKLAGSFSPSIGNLTFLRIIDLAGNNFLGKIPPEIGRLFRLQHLNLSQNLLHGVIPANLTHCLDLKLLDLIENNLIGGIPLQLSSLPKLELLGLASNNLTGNIPPSLGNISSLTRLSLARNNLLGSIPADLGRLASLRFLQVSQNKLSGTIPPSLYNLSSIYLFSVAANQLYGTLPHDLGLSFPNLEMLYVGTNQFTGSIPVSISNASGLAELYFTNNNFSGSVPEHLGSLQHLRKLNLGHNHLGSTKANDLAFLSSLTNCSSLEVLGIHDNSFRGMLPHSIANLSTHLQVLSTGGNKISGTVPPGIENLVNLTVLGFEINFYTGTIPVSIGKLQKLQVLAMSGNRLSGQIPTSLGNISLLNELYLGGNGLWGSIPASLGKCRHLQILQLSKNNLSGTIPKQVMELSSLSISLNLAHNSLVGSLPLQVGNLENLARLDVSKNKLSGEIPDTLGSCLSLVYLHLEENFFHGTLPQSLNNLRGIEDLDLSSNNLSGEIPRYLQTFLFLNKLNLSFNNLEGEVPKEGVFRNVSAISLLGNNKLCGGITKLQLPVCYIETSKPARTSPALKIIIPIVSVVLCLVLLLCILVIFCCKRKSGKKQLSSTSSPMDRHLKVSYRELLESTNGFSSANLIGEGRYSSVYKGLLDHEKMVVAVKVLNLQQGGASKSFKAECKALRNIRHRNLIKIITSCSSLDYKGNDFKALVLEFMSNGSIEEWLHPKIDKHKSRNLDFIQRLNIAIDVASALDYLHHHCQTPIVHCDLKPSNILLDDNMSAHVGDFGLARFLFEAPSASSQSQTSSVGIKGTAGYVAPEFGIGGIVSTYGDVYSYGVLLLEMFTGRKPTDDMFTDGLTLHKFAKMALPDRIVESVDPLLLLENKKVIAADRGKTYSRMNTEMKDCLASIIRIGLSCSARTPRKRMSMKDVVTEMHVIMEDVLLRVMPPREN